MKKIIVIVFAICLISMASCSREKFYGEYGIVIKVEYNTYNGGSSGKYIYDVKVRHPSSIHNVYGIKTNHLYQVGDTIVIAGKKYR